MSSIRSRGAADNVYIDLHLQVPPQMDTQQAHSVAMEAERRIAESIPGVVETLVHVEPARPEDFVGAWQELSLSLRRIAEGLGIGLHNVHAHVERTGSYSVEGHLEVEAGLTLGQAHTLANQFERRVRAELPQVHSLTTHIDPLPRTMPGEDGMPSEQHDALRRRIQQTADSLAGPGACHDVHLHRLNGHLTATLHISQPPSQLLTAAHALAQQVEATFYAQETGLDRIVVHVEPPDAK